MAATCTAEPPTNSEREPALLSYGSGFVLYALMDNVVDRYFPILEALESELEHIEENIFVRNTARSNIESLYALKQKLMLQMGSRFVLTMRTK